MYALKDKDKFQYGFGLAEYPELRYSFRKWKLAKPD